MYVLHYCYAVCSISEEYLAFFSFFVFLFILNYMIKHRKIVPVFSKKQVFLFYSPCLFL